MANQTIVDLPANAGPIATDIIPMVDDPGGTPATQKATLAQLDTLFSGTTQSLTNKTLTSPKINENVVVTTTATKLNYLTSATGTTGTNTTNVVFSTSPVLVTPTLGVATATRLGIGQAADANNLLDLAAGTNSAAPLAFTNGANLSTAAAGAVEYDGTAFYSSPVANIRGVSPSVIFTSIGGGAFTGTNVNTVQPVFNTTEDVLSSVPSSTGYIFEAMYNIVTSGATSHALQILFGGTATITSIGYAYTSTNSTVATNTAAASGFVAVATASPVTTAVAAATNNTVILRGFVRFNVGGTFIPQFQYTAAPGSAPTIQTGSYFLMFPIGSNTVKFVGNWA